MTAELHIDVETLKCEIKKTYARVSTEQDAEFIFPTGRAWALDLGSGAGTDSLVAAQMVGPSGGVVGLDMTPEMVGTARASARAMDAGNAEFLEGEAEQVPFPSERFDVVISNGVIDLIPDKDAVFGELFRVLKPGGRIQLADVTIQQPVSEEGRRKIDLWTG